MSDTARDYQTNNAATTNGMDDLFDVVPTSADSYSIDADTVATVSDSGSWVTVIEAASFIKKSERTIQRYAKGKKFKSKTDEFGRLLIWLPTNADIPVAVTSTVATIADNKPSVVTGFKGVATLADSSNDVATSSDSQRLWDLLAEKDAKIEALLMRNGYLQAQMETSQETIKLLTDSQHKPGWWAKFSSWFFKGQ
jgi:hypothetical protein